MNRFTVVWRPEAKAELVTIWMAASNRAFVTAAANEIDAKLANNPLGIGEPVKEGFFRLERAPLTVLFNVSELDRIVKIELVRVL